MWSGQKLRMTKFPPKYFNMKNVNLTLHVSSRRVHCILGVHVSSAYSLLGIPSGLAFGLTWRTDARRSVARRTVAPAFGLPGVRSPWRSAPWRSVATPIRQLLDCYWTLIRQLLDSYWTFNRQILDSY